MSTTATRTIADLTHATGVTIVADWADDIEIPVLSGLQRQGDVIVIPATGKATTAVPATGCPVVRGEADGNTHAIHADHDAGVTCDTTTATGASLKVATLTVPAGATAWLGHPEHGFIGIAPGCYEIRRQREMAEELRVVAD